MQTAPATSPLSSSETAPIPSPLLTSAESLFHACLENLTAQRCHIQCKPRLCEILQHENVAGFLRICQRHIDFVIYRKEDWLPMVGIEFEDESPGKASRKTRDRQLVNEIFQTMGIPLLQVNAREISQMDTLVHKLSTAWQRRNTLLESLPTPALEPPPAPVTQPLTNSPTTTRLTKTACTSLT